MAGKKIALRALVLAGAVIVLAACETTSSEMPTLGKTVGTPLQYIIMCQRQPESEICKHRKK